MVHKTILAAGAFFFRFRNYLFPAFVVVVVLLTRPGYFLGRADIDRFVVPLAAATAILGGVFRLLVIGFAYIKRGGKDGRVYASVLVTRGFYAHVRNPMYIGNYAILTGVGVIYGSIWIYLVLIPFFTFAYYAIVVTEEEFLRGKFGPEFEAYCRSVNRFIPRLKGIRKSLKEFRYDWRKALRKDYGTFSGIFTICLCAWLLKLHYLEGLPWSTTALWMGSAAAVYGAFCWIVRFLKKAGHLDLDRHPGQMPGKGRIPTPH